MPSRTVGEGERSWLDAILYALGWVWAITVIVIVVLYFTGCATHKPPKIIPKGLCAVEAVDVHNEPTLLHCRYENGKDGLFKR